MKKAKTYRLAPIVIEAIEEIAKKRSKNRKTTETEIVEEAILKLWKEVAKNESEANCK